MDVGACAGGGGPAPFLIKTYDMVDDSSTDGIVSWSSSYTSFVVWNAPEFSRLLLPTYFKHNNYSSFIRQLNTYGFRKIDPERWEFANEDFVKDQKHLLKNIHRRKPVHSHSQSHNPLGHAERKAYEEQIDKLSREKSAFRSNLLRFENQLASTNAQMDILEKQVLGMEQRQLRMMSFLANAVQNPSFVENLIRLAGTTVDFSMVSKKRRLLCIEFSQDFDENDHVNTQRSSSKLDDGFSNQDFSYKLKLESCPAVSDCTLMSTSVQNSMEDGECLMLNASNEDPKAARMGAIERSSEPEVLELSDTGTCSGLKKILSLFGQSTASESLEDGDGDVCCQLNLSLASSKFLVDRYSHSSSQDLLSTSKELSSNSTMKEVEPTTVYGKNPEKENAVPSMQGSLHDMNLGSGAPQTRVNDVFWEHFLTERPGCSDNEAVNSSLKSHSYAEQEERTTGRSIKDVEQLTL